MNATPEEVLKNLRADIKEKKIRRKHLAAVLGFTTDQSVTNLFNSKHYLNKNQAEALSSHYSYNPEYLTKGVGKLNNINRSYNKLDLDEEIIKGFEPLNCPKAYFSDYDFMIYVLHKFKEVAEIIQDPYVKEICQNLIDFRASIQLIIKSFNENAEVDEQLKDIEVAYGLHQIKLSEAFNNLRDKYKSAYTCMDNEMPIKINDWDSFILRTDFLLNRILNKLKKQRESQQ